MLLNITLKRIVGFHGHICPDLIIGCRFCEYVQHLLSPLDELKSGISVVSENSTSAVDAIQIMLGTTVGNQRLQILDHGKHSYTLRAKTNKSAFRLVMKKLDFDDDRDFDTLDRTMRCNQARWEDSLSFRKLLDRRVRHLLDLRPEEIFDVKPVNTVIAFTELASVYLTCGVCGEQVLKSRHISFRDQIYCSKCFQTLYGSMACHRLQ